jgi:hypothetical protein
MRLWIFCNKSGISKGLCLHDILVVLLLCIVGAMVLAVGCLLVGLLSLWCHIVANATGRFRRLMVEATGAMEWAFAVEVEVAMGEGWVACMLDQTEALASVPVGKEYQIRVEALLVLPFLYQCTASMLQCAMSRPCF